MARERPPRSFWTTLPGILTGVAAVIAALGGLFGGLAAVGVIGGGSPPIVVIAPTATVPTGDTPNTQTIPTPGPTAEAIAATTLAPTDTPAVESVATPIPTDTRAPAPTPTPTSGPTILDLSGTWFYATGFVEINKVPLQEGQYTYQDYNSFQILVAEGVATQTTGRLNMEGINFVLGLAIIEFEIFSDALLQGLVCYPSGCSPITLTR